MTLAILAVVAVCGFVTGVAQPAEPVDQALEQLRANQPPRERYRMRDAVALYEAMAARPEPAPDYVKLAAASAYLYLEQPETARDLYRAARAADPANLESHIGLYYALADSEEHADAPTSPFHAALQACRPEMVCHQGFPGDTLVGAGWRWLVWGPRERPVMLVR